MAPLVPLTAAVARRSSLASLARRATRSASTIAPKARKPTLTTAAARAALSVDEYGMPRKPLPPLSLDSKAKATAVPRFSALKKAPVASTSAATSAASRKREGKVRAPSPDPLPKPLELLDEHAFLTQGDFERGVRRDLARYPDAILLTQVGLFYESYFDQAPLVSRLTGIKLTSKLFGKGDAKTRLSFCGFPVTLLGKYAVSMIETGHRVVVVDEFKDEEGYIERRVTRILTPGTAIDEGLVKLDQMNWVLAVGVVGEDGQLDLAYRDISTGSSFTKLSTLEQLRDDILLIEPKEVVVSARLADSPSGAAVLSLLKAEEEREPWIISSSTTSSPTDGAESVLSEYLASMFLATPPPKTTPTHVDPASFLQMDSVTLKSLEIRHSLRGGVSGSLISTIRRTVTPGGARLLAERLCSPSTVLSEINTRLSLVSAFQFLSGTRQYLRALLKPLADTSRILQRLSLHRATALDLVALRRTIEASAEVVRTLEEDLDNDCGGVAENEALEGLVERMEVRGYEEVGRRIGEAVDAEALERRVALREMRAGIAESLGEKEADATVEEKRKTEGLWGPNEDWSIKFDFSGELAKAHATLVKLRREAHELEKALRKNYDSPGLTLKAGTRTGPMIWVSTRDGVAKIEADPAMSRLTKSGTTQTYQHGVWAALNSRINESVKGLEKLEAKTISILISSVLERMNSLSQMSSAMDELDISLAFAELSLEMDLVRPSVNDGTSLTIVGGRHPTVQKALQVKGRPFVANSIHFSHPGAFVHCLTGPNMAGKSTFIRQNALIVILAQAGSFVPADSAEIGIVDRVFSRVGARDELDRDRSTFFIEMDECTSILKTATDRSLVLFDELGRGTSPLDGLAIAYAALEHIVNINRSRTLFATHYHRLGELMGYDEANPRGEGAWEGVEFWCTDVHESEDSVTYSHAVRRGLNPDSAGIIIARLAGMPERAIKVAQELRERYTQRPVE